MKSKVKTTILLAWLMGILVVLSGCSSVIDQIQKTTGNNVEQVETKVGGQAYQSEPSGEEQQLAPIPATELKHILMDDGIGRYAGEKFDRIKVFEALSQIPKGMSSEKIYAYLLGLVGENYKMEDSYFMKFTPNYQSQVDLIKHQPKSPSSQSKKANVIVFLNITDSMGKEENGKSKFQEAKEALKKFAASLPSDANLSVGIFGHKAVVDNNPLAKCKSPEIIYPKQPYNAQKLQAALEQTYPAAAESPLSLAVRSTFEQTDSTARNVVIIITDQADQCGGDPVREAEEIHFSKQVSTFQVIGLDVSTKDEIELKQLATTAGGNFSKTSDQQEIEETLGSIQKEIARNNQPWQLVALSKITEAYRTDQNSLKESYQGVVDKLNLEYERLVEANDYIKELQKINAKEWAQMDKWIEDRYKQVGKHMSDLLKNVNAKIDAEWKNSVSRLEQDWKADGKSVEEFNQYKESVMRAHSITPSESSLEIVTEQSGSINGSSE